jgi:hypothetical protein
MPLRPIRIDCFVIIAAMKLLKMAMHSVVRVRHVPVAVPTQGTVFPSLIVFLLLFFGFLINVLLLLRYNLGIKAKGRSQKHK